MEKYSKENNGKCSISSSTIIACQVPILPSSYPQRNGFLTVSFRSHQSHLDYQASSLVEKIQRQLKPEFRVHHDANFAYGPCSDLAQWFKVTRIQSHPCSKRSISYFHLGFQPQFPTNQRLNVSETRAKHSTGFFPYINSEGACSATELPFPQLSLHYLQPDSLDLNSSPV